MSTDILNDESPDFNGVYLNQFWGAERGVCHQITVAEQSGEGYVQLTRAQMTSLVNAWIEWLSMKETPNEPKRHSNATNH